MTKKILLADSSVTIQKVVELSLSDEGFEVASVRDGEAALKLAEDVMPDIILADVFLPQVDGYELCKRVRSSDKLKDVPVILLVGQPDSFDMNKADMSGASDFINKPFESSELIEKIASYSGGSNEDVYEVMELNEEDIMPANEQEEIKVEEIKEKQDSSESALTDISEEIELISFENLDKARELEHEINPKPENDKDESIPFYDITELGEPAEAKAPAAPVSKEEINAAIKSIIPQDELKKELSGVLENSIKDIISAVPAKEIKEQILTAAHKYSKEIAAGVSKDEIMAEMSRILNQVVRERVGGISSQEMKEEQMRLVREASSDMINSISSDAVMRELRKGIEEQGKRVIEDATSKDTVNEMIREVIQKQIPADLKNEILTSVEQEAKRLAKAISMDDIEKEIEKSTSRIFEDKIEGLIINISRDIAEKVVWEVVPSLAEVIINKEIERLTAEEQGS